MAQEASHDTKISQVLAVVITFTALSLTTVILRLYTRFLIIKKPSREDAFIVMAMIFTTVLGITYIYQVHYALGRHIYTVDPAILPTYFHMVFTSIIIYNFSLVFTKVSILLQYLRLVDKPRLRKAIWAMIAFVTAFCIEVFFAVLFQCSPVAFFWNKSIRGGTCTNTFVGAFANAGVNILTDFSILFFPILIMKDSIMPRTQKYIITGVLSLGGAACIASILRLYYLYRHGFSAAKNDPTWAAVGTVIWSDLEVNIGIICGSLCTLRPLLSRIFPKIQGIRNRWGSESEPHPAKLVHGRFNFFPSISTNATSDNPISGDAFPEERDTVSA